MVSSFSDSFVNNLPSCASNCFTNLLNTTPCAITDTMCICTTQSLLESAMGCFTTACTVKESLTSINASRSACGIPEENEVSLTPILAGTLGMLAVIMVTLRLVQRIFIKGSFGWDDWLILMALLCAVPLNALAFPMANRGLGTNIWTIPFNHITEFLQFLYFAEIFYMPAEAFTQLSFLVFYLRIFPGSVFQIMVYTLMALSVCFGISNTFVMIFQCTPVSFFWNGWSGEYMGTCINISNFSWFKATMQIAMDVSIIGLPMWPLSRLRLSPRKKTFIILMFCTGFLITVVSCLRLQSLIKFSKSSNSTIDNNPAIYWSMVECDVAIICACMPCLPSLLKPCFPSCFTTEHYESNANDQSPHPVRLDRIKIRKDTTITVTKSSSQDGLVDRGT